MKRIKRISNGKSYAVLADRPALIAGIPTSARDALVEDGPVAHGTVTMPDDVLEYEGDGTVWLDGYQVEWLTS